MISDFGSVLDVDYVLMLFSLARAGVSYTFDHFISKSRCLGEEQIATYIPLLIFKIEVDVD